MKNNREILVDVKYKDWLLKIGIVGDHEYLQWVFLGIDIETDTPQWQHCRKWLLSEHMTKSEVVATAFKAALSAEEHECREAFTYKGVTVYGPHASVDSLMSAEKDARHAITNS